MGHAVLGSAEGVWRDGQSGPALLYLSFVRLLRLEKRSAIFTKKNDSEEHLPENETCGVYKCFTSSGLLFSVGPRKDISKSIEDNKTFSTSSS